MLFTNQDPTSCQVFYSKKAAKKKSHFDSCLAVDFLQSWTPFEFSDLEFLYISPRFLEECPHSPKRYSEDQLEMIEKYQQMLANGEEVPPKTEVAGLPLAPITWSPL